MTDLTIYLAWYDWLKAHDIVCSLVVIEHVVATDYDGFAYGDI